MTASGKRTLHAMILEGCYGFGNCAYGAFIVTMLTDNGYSAALATGLLTCMSAVSFVTQPITGYLCDSRFSHRSLLLLLTGCTIPLFLLLPGAMASLPLTILCMLLITLVMAQIPGLLDSWILSLKVSYGICRGTASLTYATAAWIMGGLTAAFGHPARLALGAAFYGAMLITAFLLKGEGAANNPDLSDQADERMPVRETVRLLLHNWTYLLLLAVAFLVFLSTNCTTTFLSTLVKELGGDAASVGTVYSIIAYCEVPVMFLMGWLLKKFSAKSVITFACALAAVRMVLTCLASDLTLMLLIQPLEGVSYAILWPACITYLSEITDERVRSTSVMTFTAVTGGICSIFGSAAGTMILSATDSARMVFACTTGAVILGFLLALYGHVRRIWK